MSGLIKVILYGVSSIHLAVSIVTEPRDYVFLKKPICQVEERLAATDCVVFVSEVRSLVECLSLCNTDYYTSCTGASITSSLLCLLYTHCSVQPTCNEDNAVQDHQFYSKVVCDHDGVWDSTLNTCQCKDGWVGTRCDALPKTCNDLIDSGYPSGWYNVTLDLSNQDLASIQVYCFIESSIPSFSIVSVMKSKGRSDNAKTWSSYRDGFADDVDSQLWLGLEKWHVLSQAGYDLLFIRADYETPVPVQAYWQYSKFILSGQSAKYSFAFESSSNTTDDLTGEYLMEDCLASVQNVPFSTFDNDNDSDPTSNCAEERGSGWWFNGCEDSCNLLGWNWQDGYNVSYKKRINLKGVMPLKAADLILLEMYLLTPE